MATKRVSQLVSNSLKSQFPVKFPKPPQNLVLPTLVVVLCALSFAVGVLWQRVNYLEKNSVALAANNNAAQGNQQPVQKPADPTQSVKADTLNLAEITDKDHTRGKKNAQLTWVEYSDLQCPYCKKIHPDLQKALTEYDGKLAWVYRHFPLSSIHPRAQKAAEASECVASLGGNTAFWKFLDGVFESDQQTALQDDGLVKIATAAGVGGSKVQSCMTSGEKAQNVQEDYDSGTKAGITGTPGSFLLDKKGNAWVISGAMPYATIKQIIDAALKG